MVGALALSWPIECLSLAYIPRPGPSNASPLGDSSSGRSNVSPLCTFLHGPSHASPLGRFLVMAHRTPLPWVAGRSNVSPLCTFLLLAHRMPLPWVDSSSWPIERFSLGPWARSSSWSIECLSLLWVAPAGQRNIDSNKEFHQLL